MTGPTIAECRFGAPIDREFGDGVIAQGGPRNWTGPKQFTYVRYNPDVTAEDLAALSGICHERFRSITCRKRKQGIRARRRPWQTEKSCSFLCVR